MNEYKTAFKNRCTECVWNMINDDNVKHEVFYRQTRSIELLYCRYVRKLEAVGSLIGYNDLLKEYTDKLGVVHRQAISE